MVTKYDKAMDMAGESEKALRSMLDDQRRWMERRVFEKRSDADQYIGVGIGRVRILQQQIAYARGDEERFQALHKEAEPFLGPEDLDRGTGKEEESGDHYSDHCGWAKTLYLLSLFCFHKGDLDDAEGYCRRANRHANEIRLNLKHWMWLRDGAMLGSHWWSLHTLSLLVDILACRGQGQSQSFANWHTTLQWRQLQAPWAASFPPFVPRYSWVYEARRTPLHVLEKSFPQQYKSMREGNLGMYFPDILLSWGDFLKAIGDPNGAELKYEEARQQADDYGLKLLEKVAKERIKGHSPDFGPIEFC